MLKRLYMSAQPFPKHGDPLFKNLDLGKTELAERIPERSDCRFGRVYAYILTTVILDQGTLQQTGTGPNFQGGCLTLCTCKHRMRASLPCGKWQDNWIAGFTSLACERHWLFYLARVKDAYDSHSVLWNKLPLLTRRAKSATCCNLGDLYEPIRKLDSVAQFGYRQYCPPISGHDHRPNACDNEWRLDIDYSRKKLKRKAKHLPSLLVGDPKLSFLWQKGKLYIEGNFRTRKWDSLSDFLSELKC